MNEQLKGAEVMEQNVEMENRVKEEQAVTEEQTREQETGVNAAQVEDAVTEATGNVGHVNEASPETDDAVSKETEPSVMDAGRGSENKKNDDYVELLERNNYVLNMHIAANSKSRRSKGCKFYLTKKGSSIPLITGEDEITISSQKLMQATDHRVMAVLHGLDVGFTEDDIQEAFDKARACVEGSTARMEERAEMTIDEAYTALMREAVRMAKAEAEKIKQSEMESDTPVTRDFKYDETQKNIKISKKRFRQILEDMECGFTATTFCKKLAILESHLGISIMQRNSGRCGYDYATVDMGRVYSFKIVDLSTFENGMA